MTSQQINRRQFIKLSSGIVASLAVPQLSCIAQAAGNISTNKLVILHLRGGNDGLNTIVPTESSQYSLYQELRPTIHVPSADLLDIGSGLDGMTYGLNPALSPLLSVRDNLALFPATHCGPGANRSHFYQFRFYSSGEYTTRDQLIPVDDKGWVGRYLEHRYTDLDLEAFDFFGGDSLFTGERSVLVNSNPESVYRGVNRSISDHLENEIEGYELLEEGSIQDQYSTTQRHLFEQVDRLENAFVDEAQVALASQPRFSDQDRMETEVAFSGAPIESLSIKNQKRLEAAMSVSANPQQAASYPSTTLGRQFRQTATLLREIPEMETVHLVQGGYDTHTKQTDENVHPARLADLGGSLAAFMDDLGSEKENVMVIVKTEFGRTSKQNESENPGTDHGRASCWMALGGRVQGGVYGSWPGLEEANLDSGRYLKETVDYRDILGEVMSKHLNHTDLGTLFPGYSGTINPLDFMS